MNKSIAILLVLAFSLPVAAGTVTITIVDNGDCTADIRYAADANIRAFALDVTVDAGVITDITNYFVGECNAVSKGYGVFPGTVEILDTGEVQRLG
jgi:tetrahydromethanopterin S-methyltransferase subunit E